MANLAEALSQLRRLKGWTLRQVEELTSKKVSNSYLYQLETGSVKEPSPNILYELAKVYDVEYRDLMEAAGYVSPTSNSDKTRKAEPVAFSSLKLSAEEKTEVLNFVEYLRSKRRKA